MSTETSKDKSALDHIDCFGFGCEWEWPAVWLLIALTVFWLWRTHRKNKVQKLKSEELVRNSLTQKSSGENPEL